MVRTDLTGISGFVGEAELRFEEAEAVLDGLKDNHIGQGGSGWLRLPREYGMGLSRAIKDAAARISKDSEVLVVVGIGGSYLGARAAIELLRSPHYNLLKKDTPDIYFAGNTLSGEHLEQIIALIGNRNFSVNYVSKSGSTLEPSIAFRALKSLLVSKYGPEEASKRIYVTTDGSRGTLRALAEREGYLSFEIPADVGGRYSVLTAVGLLPAAVAGIDIDEVMAGARDMAERGEPEAIKYACARQALYSRGKKVEVLASFEPAFRLMGEWWKQLFGESEGKEGKGIFPAYAEFTADLHSLGQYIQSGERMLFETFVSFEKTRDRILVPRDDKLDDGLEALSGRPVGTANAAALVATKAAHIDGGVPVIELKAPEISPYCFGALVQFFETACAVSAILSGVNPFDQPGVEAYKKNLQRILGLRQR